MGRQPRVWGESVERVGGEGSPLESWSVGRSDCVGSWLGRRGSLRESGGMCGGTGSWQGSSVCGEERLLCGGWVGPHGGGRDPCGRTLDWGLALDSLRTAGPL